MQRPGRVENWWTRRTSDTNNRTPVEIATARVRYYLTIYPQLEGAAHGAALWGADDDAPKLFVPTSEDYPGGPAWEENACIKADLDRSLKQCTRMQQRAVQAKFREGVDYRTAAAKLRQPRTAIQQRCTLAIKTMGMVLAGKSWDKTGSCNDGNSRGTHIASPGHGHDSA